MADDVVTISVPMGTFSDASGDQATYVATLQVDYTTGTVSGDFSIQGIDGNGFGAMGHFERLIVTDGNQYTATGQDLTVVYDTQTPDSARIEFQHGNDLYDTGANVSVGSNVDSTACFVAGTAIATPNGDVAAEDLRPGDVVTLATGGTARIAWTGHRRARASAVIRFRPGSLPVGPERDLRVSADHAMFIDGALVPAALLVNGDTILREPRDVVVLHHIELEAHGILLAEGAPAESYLDTGNREKFANCALDYDPAAATQDPCFDMVLAGSRLEHLRSLLPVALPA